MPVKLLDEEIIKQLSQIFDAQLEHPVEIILFYDNNDCASCEDTRHLLEEITVLSDKLYFSAFELKENPQLAQLYHVDLTPGLVIIGRDAERPLDYGIRFTGIPSGYEFSSLIQDILLVSKRDSGLKPEIRSELKGLTKPVHLQVFVTPT
jgi:alkyl hydroperoxide reductase subunit AhpF